MSSKTKSAETSTEKIRMVRALLLDTPKPSQFQPRLQFFNFVQYFSIFQFEKQTTTPTPRGRDFSCPPKSFTELLISNETININLSMRLPSQNDIKRQHCHQVFTKWQHAAAKSVFEKTNTYH